MSKILKYYIGISCILAPVLYYFSRLNYTLFHSIIELIILVIGINIFVVSQIPRIIDKKYTMLIRTL